MLRLVNNLTKLTISQDATFYQTVRWRKPLWMGTAKSKLFRLRPKRVIFPGEPPEVLRLFNNYRTSVKSIKSYLTEKYSMVLNDVSQDHEEQKRIFDEDFARCNAINNKWNEEQKIRREKYVADALEERLKIIKGQVEEELILRDQKKQEIEEIVKAVKDEAKHFIKEEDLDSVIDHALANPIDYEYALTLKGQKISGRNNNDILQEEVAIKQ